MAGGYKYRIAIVATSSRKYRGSVDALIFATCRHPLEVGFGHRTGFSSGKTLYHSSGGEKKAYRALELWPVSHEQIIAASATARVRDELVDYLSSIACM